MTSPVQQIVTSTRGGRMTKWKGRVASAAPYMLVASVSTLALSSSLAHAETFSTPTIGAEVVVAGEDHVVTSTGSVTLTSSSDAAIEIDGDYANTFTNNGSIEVTGTSVETATGLSVDGNLLVGGQIINNGTISLEHTYSSTVYSYGIDVNGAVDGTISNTGSIVLNHTQLDGMTANNTEDFEGYGIYADSVGETGQINNSGTINVSGLSEETATGYGIYIENESDGDITNSGTIDIRVTSETDYAYGYGISIDGDLGETGSILNSGTIHVDAITTAESTASAFGIHVDGQALGAVTNTGTIDVLASAQYTYYGYAFGIEIEDELGGSISNSGTITATAFAIDSTAEAFGIIVDDDALDGSSITNSGTITAIAINETDDGAEAYGIQVDGQLGIDASVTNSGTIVAEATSTESEAEAYGIHVDSSMLEGSSLTNTGTVTATAVSGEDNAEAYGIEVDGRIAEDAVFSNTGSVTATAEALDTEAYAEAINIDGAIDGAFSNSGSIAATIDSVTEGTAIGVYVRSGVSGSFVNSGTITAMATDETSSAEAYGIDIGGTTTGTISNTGTITATASNTAADDAGLYAEGMDISTVGADGIISNSGSISAVLNNVGEATYASAYGVYISTLDGTFANSGTITATSNNDADVTDAEIYGVAIGTVNGTFSNTGVISATSSADADLADVEVYGLYISNLTGEITNAGTITAEATGTNVYAIYLGSGTGTLNLTNDDKITGKMSVAAHDVNLLANGPSAVYVFEDRDTGAGDFVTEVANDHVAWFVSDEGGSAPIYASVNAADIDIASATVASNGNLLSGLGNGMSSGDGPAVSRNSLSFGGDAMSGMRPFVSASITSSDFEGVDGANDSDAVTTDATFGYAGQMQSGLGVAIGGGVFASSGSSGPSDFDSTGVFAGVTVGRDLGGFAIEGGLGFGVLSTDNVRSMAGSDDADATIDSNFATAHIGASRAFSSAAGLTWSGFGELRYTSQNVEGYTETGSLANATVDDFTVATTQATLGIEGSYAIDGVSAVTGALTAVSRTAGGDDTMDVTVFGATSSLASTAADFSGGAFSIGYEREVAEAGVLSISASQEFGDGATGPTLNASLSWSF